MQRHKTMRRAGVSLSAVALALLTAEGTAAAHEGASAPDLRGRVTSVASGDFVIQRYDGTTETVDTTDATTYSEPGSSIAPPGVYNGENVAVTLDPTASSPTATSVLVFPERVSGRVANVAGSTVALANKRGTDTVIVSSSTQYYQKDATPTAVSDGEIVTVFGLPDASTPSELDAQVVAIFSPAAQPQPPQPPQPPTQQPEPTPPATAAVTQGAQPGKPEPQPTAPKAPPAGGGWSAPSGQPAPHGNWSGPGAPGGPVPRGGGSPGGYGGQGFGHR
jgi:hypothetical protein